MTEGAPAAILLCMNNDFVKYTEFAIQDCSAATQNMLIEICDLNLGGVWVGLTSEEILSTFLKESLLLPKNVIPFSLIVLGHPAEYKLPHENFDIKRIHNNYW